MLTLVSLATTLVLLLAGWCNVTGPQRHELRDESEREIGREMESEIGREIEIEREIDRPLDDQSAGPESPRSL